MAISLIGSGEITQSKKLLFLGYDNNQTRLIETLASDGYEVWHSSDEIDTLEGFDLTISFGYRHIIRTSILREAVCPIINLHIGYLPYNRGSHPNFWSFYDSTPSGITIHVLDEGIDTGDVLVQRYINFDDGEVTFTETYKRLMNELEDLFIEHRSDILAGLITPVPQRGSGTYHRSSDLPIEFSGWDSIIPDEIARLDKLLEKHRITKEQLIDQIEDIRKGNNVNWMDLLRLAFLKSPTEAKALVRKINSDDNRISELFRQLGE